MLNDLNKIKEALDSALEAKLKAKRETEEIKKKTQERQEDLAIRASMHQEVIDALNDAKLNGQEIADAIAKIRIEVPPVTVPEVKMPEIKLPTINIPEIKIPTINVPEPKITVNVPKIEMPEMPKMKMPEIIMPESMTVNGSVCLSGVDVDNPLPVQLRDMNGKPVSLEVLVSGGGGGKVPSFMGVSRQYNQSVTTEGNKTLFVQDDLGRQLTRPFQVRDLIATAYATLTNGTETTLLTADAGNYLDLIFVTGSNNSDAAVSVNLRAVS